ncbi:hypothetical protein JQN72_03290 [Phycicoccus sp. CSK15P-2]|uniref:hypothetical protein n=1 Tax=Phycicoccus sp. CSK15P-2 TaxID=2807627 RepID=UPI0019500399|nr:hypothetical protein [Phycicoccus sp. CSK15P-2]MBM6403270.1 hypothetical protein [Phycicoccus sp. CSK15P-2]
MSSLVPTGLVFPESVLASGWFAVLGVFVAINTVMYVALAVGKMLPKVYVQDWTRRRYTRSQTRSIHPDADEARRPDRPGAPPAGS